MSIETNKYLVMEYIKTNNVFLIGSAYVYMQIMCVRSVCVCAVCVRMVYRTRSLVLRR